MKRRRNTSSGTIADKRAVVEIRPHEGNISILQVTLTRSSVALPCFTRLSPPLPHHQANIYLLHLLLTRTPHIRIHTSESTPASNEINTVINKETEALWISDYIDLCDVPASLRPEICISHFNISIYYICVWDLIHEKT